MVKKEEIKKTEESRRPPYKLDEKLEKISEEVRDIIKKEEDGETSGAEK